MATSDVAEVPYEKHDQVERSQLDLSDYSIEVLEAVLRILKAKEHVKDQQVDEIVSR